MSRLELVHSIQLPLYCTLSHSLDDCHGQDDHTPCSTPQFTIQEWHIVVSQRTAFKWSLIDCANMHHGPGCHLATGWIAERWLWLSTDYDRLWSRASWCQWWWPAWKGVSRVVGSISSVLILCKGAENGWLLMRCVGSGGGKARLCRPLPTWNLVSQKCYKIAITIWNLCSTRWPDLGEFALEMKKRTEFAIASQTF